MYLFIYLLLIILRTFQPHCYSHFIIFFSSLHFIKNPCLSRIKLHNVFFLVFFFYNAVMCVWYSTCRHTSTTTAKTKRNNDNQLRAHPVSLLRTGGIPLYNGLCSTVALFFSFPVLFFTTILFFVAHYAIRLPHVISIVPVG